VAALDRMNLPWPLTGVNRLPVRQSALKQSAAGTRRLMHVKNAHLPRQPAAGTRRLLHAKTPACRANPALVGAGHDRPLRMVAHHRHCLMRPVLP